MLWFPHLLITLLSLTLTLASPAPLVPRQDSNTTLTPSSSNSSSSSSSNSSNSAPSVVIYPSTSNAKPITLTGTSYPQFGQDVYAGIPFAKPPIGDLRFSPPQDAVFNTSTYQATTLPPACLQKESYLTSTGISEDCLYLNVLTPAGANGQTAYLPVVVWVYGGSFTAGSASYYNGTFFLYQGLASEKPVIFVTLNYRLGVFGFPNGAPSAAAGAANLGLRDIQKGLEWVQENIWAFGGNPDQVTVAGESAGAILISLLYLQPDIKLFKSAIMESGAQSVAPIGPTATTWNAPYDALVKLTNCSYTLNYTVGSNDSFTCLKTLPAEQILAAQLEMQNITQFAVGFVFGPSIDGDLIPDSPHTLLHQGKFAKIPFISGNNKDEGTGFTPSTTNSTAYVVEYLELLEPNGVTNQTLAEVLALYPDVPSLGSPFGTGNETFGLSSEFKRLAAILGDAAFQSNRRWFLQQANAHGLSQTWSYLFTRKTPGTADYLGAYHSIEVPYVFGIPQLPSDLNPVESLLNNYTAGDALLSREIIEYWLNFAYYTNPSPAGSNTTSWPPYSTNSTLLQLDVGNLTYLADDYRSKQIDYFLSEPKQFNYRRGHVEV
ncbi:Alpha/Beta hydrolase protein [Naematelia encephala]|uniref:Carboxylic ester hydrolase n=1 Tax=Naematelia encephala TaxID=71784 RepID=A0A1Y2ANA9_9TREE|nr:Alpha/Beta hydrolase protein [Naematelia encephala]